MFYVEQPEVGYEYLEAKIHDICPWVKMRKIPYTFDKSLIEKGLSIDNAFIVAFVVIRFMIAVVGFVS